MQKQITAEIQCLRRFVLAETQKKKPSINGMGIVLCTHMHCKYEKWVPNRTKIQ